jgi:hypothetical protein
MFKISKLWKFEYSSLQSHTAKESTMLWNKVILTIFYLSKDAETNVIVGLM